MSEQLLTCAQAAEILGMSESGVYKLIARGDLTRRANGRRDPGARGIVDRAEVEQLAAVRLKAHAAEQQFRQERAAAAVEPVRHGTGTYVVGPDGKWRWAPPDDEHDWIGTAEAADLIGISMQAIAQRCRKGTIPAVRVGSKWWIRADHARIAANVRATDGPEAVAIALDGID